MQAAEGVNIAQTPWSWIAAGHYREENVLPGGSVMTYSDGQTGWIWNSKGAQALEDPERDQVRFELFRMWFPLLLSARNPNRAVSLSGDNGIVIADKDGTAIMLTIDPATSLPLRRRTYREVGNPRSPSRESYSDWQETAGRQTPAQDFHQPEWPALRRRWRNQRRHQHRYDCGAEFREKP